MAPAAPAEHTGQAALLSPQDAGFSGTIAEGPKNKDALVFGVLDLAKLRSSRANAGIYSARDAAKRPAQIRIVLD